MRIQRIREPQKQGTWGKKNPYPKKPKTMGQTRFKEDMLQLLNAKEPIHNA